MSWYQATKHTFASHWVMDGGAIEKLKEILGHCSVLVTERCAHLRPDALGGADYGTACVDFATAKVLPMTADAGRSQFSTQQTATRAAVAGNIGE